MGDRLKDKPPLIILVWSQGTTSLHNSFSALCQIYGSLLEGRTPFLLKIFPHLYLPPLFNQVISLRSLLQERPEYNR